MCAQQWAWQCPSVSGPEGTDHLPAGAIDEPPMHESNVLHRRHDCAPCRSLAPECRTPSGARPTIPPTSQISKVPSRLLTVQIVQVAPSTSNITLPPR